MAKFINFLFALVWFVYLLCSGIHLFSKGFLLSRVAQTEFTTCNKFDELQCTGNSNEISCKTAQILKDVNSSAKICLPKKSKVVFVIIDALRYDFGIYNPDLKNPEHYQNHLKIMYDLMLSQPNKTRLMNFIADPPTTTLQRLKGMTTGSLPTFIDIGSNFASPEINEDNIIDQIHRYNLSTIFMGDSTWMELFPNRFKRKYGYPSFNIQDLDTVDRAIEKHFPKELNERDWDVIVAHFLGVDHCGHKHGPFHTEMGRKLDEMNEFITNVTNTMDDDTVLIVVGDHGMSSTGDHGGDTPNEVNSLLFMYSKGKPFNSQDFGFGEDSLQQIDLVPTLAAILGVPSPYSNLGIVNLHLLPDTSVGQLMPYQTALLHLWHNAQQIQNYFQKYAQLHRGTFEMHNLESLEHTFLILSHRVNSIYTEAAFQNFAKDVRLHLKEILQVCREIWVKFDGQLMSQGMLITFITVFLLYVLVNNLGVWQLAKIFDDKVLGFVYLSNSLIAIPSILFFKEFSMSNETHSILFFTSIFSFLILGYLIVKNWPEIADSMSKMTRYGNVITRFVFIFSCACFFSNSYLVQEQRILCYLLISLFIYFLFQVSADTNIAMDLKARFRWTAFFKSIAFKLVVLTTFALLMLRISIHFFKCREEQENCLDSRMMDEIRPQRRPTKSYDLLPVIVMAVFATVSRMYLKSCGNLTGLGVNTLLTRYGPTLAAVCAGGHFVLSKNLAHDIKLMYIDALAWVIYALFGLQILLIAASPLLVYVLPKRKDQMNIDEYNVIPDLYRKLKQDYGQTTANTADDVPIVCGLATVYSSIYIAFATIFGLLLCLLLGPQPATGFVIVISIATAIIVLNSIIRYETAATLERSLQPQFVTLVAWLLVIQFGFYATSHQPTMSQIDWNAAFVGRTMHFDHSTLLSAILVILNTFCSSFFFALLYPLLIVAPFCLYSICPSLSAKVFNRQKLLDNKSDIRKTADNVEYRRMTVNKADNDATASNGGVKTTLLHVDFDITRGEVNLFENETLFLGSAFKTGCQLLMLQGLRVCCSMMASTILCRHLMVWKIFAPRFIYEGISSYAIFISIILGYAILIRVHTSVCELVDKLNKSQ